MSSDNRARGPSEVDDRSQPPYAEAENEPGERLAAEGRRLDDSGEKHSVSHVQSEDIVQGAPHGSNIEPDVNRMADPSKPMFAAFNDGERKDRMSSSDVERGETTFGKIGGADMPPSVNTDPPSPSVGPLSRPVGLLLALILLFIVVYLVIALV